MSIFIVYTMKKYGRGQNPNSRNGFPVRSQGYQKTLLNLTEETRAWLKSYGRGNMSQGVEYLVKVARQMKLRDCTGEMVPQFEIEDEGYIGEMFRLEMYEALYLALALLDKNFRVQEICAIAMGEPNPRSSICQGKFNLANLQEKLEKASNQDLIDIGVGVKTFWERPTTETLSEKLLRAGLVRSGVEYPPNFDDLEI